jgi:hypothetical protein
VEHVKDGSISNIGLGNKSLNGSEIIRNLDPSSCQGVMLLIWALLNRQYLATDFVSLNGIPMLLALPIQSAYADSSTMLTLIIQRCMESPLELKQQMMHAIRTLFKPVRDHKVALPMFLSFASAHLLRAPEEFVTAVTIMIRFVRKSKDEDGDESNYAEIYKKDLLESRIAAPDNEDKRPDADSRAKCVLDSLLQYVTSDGLKGELVDKVKRLFTKGDILDALSDGTLVLKRLPSLLAQFRLKKIEGPSPDCGDSIPYFLIYHYFPLEQAVVTGKNLTSSTEIQSACRLLVALSTHRGTSRRVVLTPVIQAFKDNAVITPDDGKGSSEFGCVIQESHCKEPSAESLLPSFGGESNEACSKRLRSLTRLASLVTLVVKASGTPGPVDPNNPSPHSQQQVSVDVVNHFINADLPGLLSTALLSIPLGHPLAGEAINAILDPLEMLTRPKLLANLDKMNVQGSPKKGGGETRVGPDGSDQIPASCGVNVTGDQLPSLPGAESTVDTPGGGGLDQNSQYHRLPEGDDPSVMVSVSGTGPQEGGGGPGLDDHSVSLSSNSYSTNRLRHDSDNTNNNQDNQHGPNSDVDDPRVFLTDLVSASNTNARTSHNVYNGSISSATLPSEEGLFGDDDDDEGEEEEDDEERYEGEGEEEIYEGEDDDYHDHNDDDDQEENFDDAEDDDDSDEGDEDLDLDGDDDDESGLVNWTDPAVPVRMGREEERNRRFLGALPVRFENNRLPLRTSTSESAMMVLDDNEGRGGGMGEASMFTNDRNPFSLDHTRHPGLGASVGTSNFNTPPDRIRQNSLRFLLHHFQGEETGFPAPDEIFQLLSNVSLVPGGGSGIGGGGLMSLGGLDSHGFTTSQAQSDRIGTGNIRSNLGPGSVEGVSSLSDLLPGGVDRALQSRGHGPYHPLLAAPRLGDEGEFPPLASRLGGHQVISNGEHGMTLVMERPLNAPPSSQQMDPQRPYSGFGDFHASGGQRAGLQDRLSGYFIVGLFLLYL